LFGVEGPEGVTTLPRANHESLPSSR
jgi:hypothetical protein